MGMDETFWILSKRYYQIYVPSFQSMSYIFQELGVGLNSGVSTPRVEGLKHNLESITKISILLQRIVICIRLIKFH